MLALTQLSGFGAQRPRIPPIRLIGTFSRSNSAAPSFSVDIGPARAGRVIVCMMVGRDDPIASNLSCTSMTLGGQAMTSNRNEFDTNPSIDVACGTQIFSRVTALGGTVTITATYAAGGVVDTTSLVVFELNGFNAAAVFTAGDRNASQPGSFNTSSADVVFLAGFSANGAGPVSWVGHADLLNINDGQSWSAMAYHPYPPNASVDYDGSGPLSGGDGPLAIWALAGFALAA